MIQVMRLSHVTLETPDLEHYRPVLRAAVTRS